MGLQIANVRFRFFVFNAPGARGFYGRPYWYYPIWFFLGLHWWWTNFVMKTTTLFEWAGNMPLKQDGDTPQELFPRCILITWRSFLSGHVANVVGLSGPGAQTIHESGLLQRRHSPWMYSFMAKGKTVEARQQEYRSFAELLAMYLPTFAAPIVLQLNFGCPNVGLPLDELRAEVIYALTVMRQLKIPLVANFNPLVPASFLKDLEDTRLVDAFWIGNTIPYNHDDLGPQIFGPDVSPLRQRGFNGDGGISGKKCLKYTLATVRKARRLGVTKPIIGLNGVQTPLGVVRLWLAGASAIGYGTGALLRPWWMVPTVLTANLLFRFPRTRKERVYAATDHNP